MQGLILNLPPHFILRTSPKVLTCVPKFLPHHFILPDKSVANKIHPCVPNFAPSFYSARQVWLE